MEVGAGVVEVVGEDGGWEGFAEGFFEGGFAVGQAVDARGGLGAAGGAVLPELEGEVGRGAVEYEV